MVDVNKILPVVLAVLVVISLFQAYQLYSIKGKLAEGKLSISSGSKSSVLTSTGSSAASSGGAVIPGAAGVANLPTMVGGC